MSSNVDVYRSHGLRLRNLVFLTAVLRRTYSAHSVDHHGTFPACQIRIKRKISTMRRDLLPLG